MKRLADRGHHIPQFFSKFENYRDPAAHAHGQLPPLASSHVSELSGKLFDVLGLPCLQSPRWKDIHSAVHDLALSLQKYADYLRSTTKRVQKMHEMLEPARKPTSGDSSLVRRIDGSVRSALHVSRYVAAERRLQEAAQYEDVIFLNDIAPSERMARWRYMHEFSMPFAVEVYSYSGGGNQSTLYWAWRAPPDPDNSKTTRNITKINQGLKVYHTRAMRKEFVERYSFLTKLSSTVLNEMYQHLTSDGSALPSTVSQKVQQRLRLAIDAQDPELVYDLRALNSGRREEFDQFWDAARSVINQQAMQAVDDRRHSATCHMALAMSTEDFVRQVKAHLEERCDALPPIPSTSWVRYQFSPPNPFTEQATRYTGRLNLRFMIQARQLRHDHPDAHYAAAIFRYQRELAIKMRGVAALVCVDDKHQVKVGEPGNPVAAVDRGRRVLVESGTSFCVADHDFTKFKITPSVALLADIPESIDGSFYRGKLAVTLKDAVFQPSSPLRHACELQKILHKVGYNPVLRPVLLLHSDGGPDHRLTYISVQAALIALFKRLNLDYLLATRTAPFHSYKNPVERCMSILNMGMQSVGLMRAKLDEDFEQLLKPASSLADIRELANHHPGLSDKVQQSLQPCIALMNNVFERLHLKDEAVTTHGAATDEEIDELWTAMQDVDKELKKSETTQKATKDRAGLEHFLQHCCVRRHYFFEIKKCGDQQCTTCGPTVLPSERFAELQAFPDPVIRQDDKEHFKSFGDCYGTTTTESDRPSLRQAGKKNAFSSEVRGVACRAECVRATVSCSECEKPRCVFAEHKLSSEHVQELQAVLHDNLYTCGAPLWSPEHALYDKVVVRDIDCEGCIEPAYYSCRRKYQSVCYVCGDKTPLPVPPALKARCQSVHPVCAACKASGKVERIRGEKKGSKRKHCDD